MKTKRNQNGSKSRKVGPIRASDYKLEGNGFTVILPGSINPLSLKYVRKFAGKPSNIFEEEMRTVTLKSGDEELRLIKEISKSKGLIFTYKQ